MATMVLSTVGGVVGGMIGGPYGAIAGRALGALGGSMIDNQLFAETRQITQKPLGNIRLQTSAEGKPLPFVYGSMRVSGEIIWATNFLRETTHTNHGGKASKPKTRVTTHRYFASFAVALCAGEVQHLRRIWADGKPLDPSGIALRFYNGSANQLPDPLISAHQGETPAYRGVCYVVFERLPLADYGNRIPQLSFEITRSIEKLETQIEAVTLIPGAGEFIYATTEVRAAHDGQGKTTNRHQVTSAADVLASLDELQSMCPNLKQIALVVSWFADDLRCHRCRIRPKVERASGTTTPLAWSVAGQTRAQAEVLSQIEGRPAYGGTPSDNAVRQLIGELKRRGLRVVLYPFLMMDIPQGNTLPNPYGLAAQPAYPWRGRITVTPAPGRSGSPDGSAAALAQISAFTDPTHGEGYRRFIRHYAQLAKECGGVDAFLIGSELRGLTRVLDETGKSPFVANLQEIARDCRQLLGPATKLSYAADWSEYGGFSPRAGELRFPLDPLWANEAIDFIGIDAYFPLSDISAADDPASAYDLVALKNNISGGEYYDWYYASNADRVSKKRSPITDGAHNKPWVFRAKALCEFWGERHYERLNGAELPEPTEYLPKAKPIWYTEVGAPAIDGAANQPNVFVDPKSAEHAMPHHSTGARDDLAQRRFLQAVLEYWQENAGTEKNPYLPQTSQPMLAPENMFLWTWDARPYPQFPSFANIWSDAENWQLGHWLNGRLGKVSLAGFIKAFCEDMQIPSGLLRADGAAGMMHGAMLEPPLSVRSALERLLPVFGCVAADRGDYIAVLPRWRGAIPNESGAVRAITQPQLIAPTSEGEGPLLITRGEVESLPQELRLHALDPLQDYERLVVSARNAAPSKKPLKDISLPIAMEEEELRAICEKTLQVIWQEHESVALALPTAHADLRPGDVLALDKDPPAPTRTETTSQSDALAATKSTAQSASIATNTPAGLFRVEEIDWGAALSIVARRLSDAALPPTSITVSHSAGASYNPSRPVAPRLLLANLPLYPTEKGLIGGLSVASFASPWPGSVMLLRAGADGSFTPHATLPEPATLGTLPTPLAAGPLWRWDDANILRVSLAGGALNASPAAQVLAGAGAAAIIHPDGTVELLQFAKAELHAANTYLLSHLLRGQNGTEAAARAGAPAGSRFLLLDEAVLPLPYHADEVGLAHKYRAIAVDEPLDTAFATKLEVSCNAAALRPRAPVHLRRRIHPDGAVTLRWIRRTRHEGDSWQWDEIPLQEQAERYQVSILSPDGTPHLKASVSGPHLKISAEQRQQVVSTSGQELTVEVAQLGEPYGAGEKLRQKIKLPLL
ncbi:baseplate multidomain protein megatron [Polycladidibacter hongkongensis]|uniref:baseplate multidomain protein megatron n=1 Tax=Polycladidibacter hongkongensis TaxID=1647556 RepID=UPI00082D9FE4|nr:glycoside hydrolase TIM-barrel-like domain-containing protein [Pseudovibrio hongkongensis]